jgi:hypothetical protein
MAYGTYKTYEEVATKFEIKLKEAYFIQEKEIIVKKDIFNFIKENLETRRNYITENAICETMISPILNIVSKNNSLPIWSHVRFDISEAEGLIGIPDFIAAPASDIGTTFEIPVICVAEAKRENFNEGWAQGLAEMISAQKFNKNDELEIFGIITSGNFWQFGKLKKNILTMEIVSYSALENLQKVFDILNWIFYEARKEVERLKPI